MRLFRRLKTKYGIEHPFYVLSMLACLVFCVLITGYTLVNYNSGFAGGNAITQEVTPEEFRMFGEEVFDTVIGSYSQVVAIGIESLLAVIVHGFLALLNAFIGMPLSIETTMFSVPEILIATVVVYSIGKLLQCFRCTRSFTMLTYGEFERIFGYLMMVMITCGTVTKLIYICEKYKSVVNTIFYGMKTEWAISVFVFLVGLCTAFIGMMIFYITKTLVLGLQIMQLSISFFPFTSFVFEVLRSGLTIIMAVFNLLFPRMGFSFNCAICVVGIIFLSQTSSSVEYFRVMYLESLLVSYYRFKGQIAQLYKDVPREIHKRCQNSKGMILPVFSMEQFSIGNFDVTGHEKLWMEITAEGLVFYRKKKFSRKVESVSVLKEEKKWYFKENWKCLELFDLNGPEENIIRLFQKPERKIAFAISREYEGIFKEITDGIGATDYNALKAKLTEERRSYIEKENKAFYAVTQ